MGCCHKDPCPFKRTSIPVREKQMLSFSLCFTIDYVLSTYRAKLTKIIGKLKNPTHKIVNGIHIELLYSENSASAPCYYSAAGASSSVAVSETFASSTLASSATATCFSSSALGSSTATGATSSSATTFTGTFTSTSLWK